MNINKPELSDIQKYSEEETILLQNEPKETPFLTFDPENIEEVSIPWIRRGFRVRKKVIKGVTNGGLIQGFKLRLLITVANDGEVNSIVPRRETFSSDR